MSESKPPSKVFQRDANSSVALTDRREFIRKALHGYEATREKAEAAFGNWQQARGVAAEIKWESIEKLDVYLEQFADNLEARGIYVAWAPSAQDAVDYILALARRRNAKSIIKSKTMTSEEIHLNSALEKAGFEVVESDLGEFIVQLRSEPPYHFVFPAMHLLRGEISELFQRELGTVPTHDPEELTLIARRVLREKYLEADIGISGANFGVAETGMISITENEGNARLTCALPKVHVALMGIEKVIPRMEDLVWLLPMLAAAGTGQHLTAYNTLYSGARQPEEADGPEEMHVILLDNHRTTLLTEPSQRDALRCIRCGACLNVCPIFKNIGGFSYGTTYQGPIGSVITPHLRGLRQWGHLSHASSLCGACTETCPVQIDLHHHLLRNREHAFRDHPDFRMKVLFTFYRWMMRSPWLYRLASRLRNVPNFWPTWLQGTRWDPVRGWRRCRKFPESPPQTFKEFWRQRKHP
jgi:L-lactate dehydrogenase complex protein LldF